MVGVVVVVAAVLGRGVQFENTVGATERADCRGRVIEGLLGVVPFDRKKIGSRDKQVGVV